MICIYHPQWCSGYGHLKPMLMDQV